MSKWRAQSLNVVDHWSAVWRCKIQSHIAQSIYLHVYLLLCSYISRYRSSLSTINSIHKSTLWYIMLTSEFCFERIFVDCCTSSLISTSLSKHYALFLWKFDIFKKYEEYRENDCHCFADMLKNYTLIAIKYEMWIISLIKLDDC